MIKLPAKYTPEQDMYVNIATKMRNEFDMLDGNINRMSLTKDADELKSTAEWAKIRIDRILEMKLTLICKEES